MALQDFLKVITTTNRLKMKTLIFCTSHFDSEELYKKRYQKWINYYNYHPFTNDKYMYLIDDCSDLKLVTDDEIHTFNEDELGKFQNEDKINLYSFHDRKGLNWSHNSANNEGWWRSFCTSLKIAEKYNYEKIIHIESDAFLISKRIFDHIDNLKMGWTAFWVPKYNFPESCIQVICKDQFDNFRDFSSCGYHELSKKGLAEKVIPFTNIERKFVGDRYGEKNNHQMKGLDYFCQTKLDTIITAESSDTLEGFNSIVWRTLWSLYLFQFFWSARKVLLVIIAIGLILLFII
jgi:hypothetical protein|tara:strand:+ start:346 stop:1218 length:873 start_codon:yes stop_codon:yes gene_type:complete